MKQWKHKKILFLAASAILIMGLLAGCGNKNDTVKVDEAFVADYILALENNMGEEFTFTSTADIPSQALFTFFLSVADQNALKANEQEDALYHIPVATVNDTLSLYFTGYQFDPADLEDYNKAEDTIDIESLGQFGGDITATIEDQKQEGNQLTLTVKLHTDSADVETTSDNAYTKVYTMEITADGYQYISIVKQ